MKTVRINKHNWSGEESDIKLYKDGLSASIPEYKVRFRLTNPQHFEELELDFSITNYSVEIDDGSGYRETDWKVETNHLVGESGYHRSSNWSGDLTRESTKDPRLAVAQLIFNVY